MYIYVYIYIWGPEIDLHLESDPKTTSTGDIHSIKASNAAGTRQRVEAFGKREDWNTKSLCFLIPQSWFCDLSGTNWPRKSIAGDC